MSAKSDFLLSFRAPVYRAGSEDLIANHLELAASTSARLVGLLGRSHLNPESALILYPCSSVHMWFMRFPIDVVFASKSHEVVAIYHDLQPWSWTYYHPKSTYALECSSGTLSRAKVELGDILIYGDR